MEKKFEQIQYCAIVQYQSPLTQDIPIVGVFYKQSWEFKYRTDGKWHSIKVTPSQRCRVIKDSLDVIIQEYMEFHNEKIISSCQKQEEFVLNVQKD